MCTDVIRSRNCKIAGHPMRRIRCFTCFRFGKTPHPPKVETYPFTGQAGISRGPCHELRSPFDGRIRR